MAETKARFLANLIGADNTSNDFTLPNVAVSGTEDKVLTSGGDGTVTWETTVSAPTFTSMSGTVNEDDQTTLTINGGDFAAGMTVDVYNNSGTKLNTTSLTTNLITTTQITVVIPNNTSTNGFPIASGTVIYLKIIKSGLTVNTSNITVNADPVWGSVSSPYVNVDSGATGNIGSALTAPTISSGSGTITYSIATQPSDGVNKYSINSSRQISVDSTSNSSAGNLASSASPKTDAIAVRATGPAGATQASDLAVNIAVYQYPGAGGTIVEPGSYNGGGYRSHTFTSVGTTTNGFTLYTATTVEVLVVAGGGGGGGTYGSFGAGGGGAGGFRTATLNLSAGSYDVTVGDGGAGGSNASGDNRGTNGDDSVFSTITATGGGGGGMQNNEYSGNPSAYTERNTGRTGGSGGGSGGIDSNIAPAGQGIEDSGTFGTATNQGNDGGQYANVTNPGSGGGGGAGGAGATATTGQAGNGGAGRANYYRDGNTSGTTAGTHIFAGGGGGGIGSTGTAGSGGSGGGGAGAKRDSHAGTAGTDGTGGGGGGSANGKNAGSGGSGIVVIRYQV